MEHEYKRLNCVLHPEREALGTASQIPVCDDCRRQYEEEGRKYLPMEDRVFYRQLLWAERKTQEPRNTRNTRK